MSGKTSKHDDGWSGVAATVGGRVRAARQAVKLTQEGLAIRAGVTRVTVNQLERGRRRRLNPDVLRAIAHVTGQQEDYFYALHTPADALARLAQEADLVPQLRVLLPRVAALSPAQQDRLGSILEQLLGLFEGESSVPQARK